MFSPRFGMHFKLISVLAITIVAHSLDAATITLAPVADTTLFELFPTNNLGGEHTFISGVTANAHVTGGLLRFDIAGTLPANATIQSASLNLTVIAAIATEPSSFTLHR